MTTRSPCFSFLVRLWRDDDRFVVESERIPDGERKFFPSADAFVEFLQELETSARNIALDENPTV